MKKVIWFLTIILVQACTAQKQISKKTSQGMLNHTDNGMMIDTKDGFDVILANLEKGSSLISIYFGLSGFNEGTHFFDLSIQSIPSRDLLLTNKHFHFFNGEKHMKIECKCKMRQNYYLKNVKIKEGNYKLTYNRRARIKGEQMKVSDSIQNLLFKNIRVSESSNPKNIYFKNLEFTILDLSDTLNVKLEKVN